MLPTPTTKVVKNFVLGCIFHIQMLQPAMLGTTVQLSMKYLEADNNTAVFF